MSSPIVIGTTDNQGDSFGVMEIGTIIKTERERRGLSQELLAKAVNISQPAIKKIESGQTQRSRYLADILRFLDLADPRDVGQQAQQQQQGYDRPLPDFFDGRDTIPVYAAAEGGDGHLVVSLDEIDRIPRPHTLKGIRDAYGILVTGESMIPAYRPGDTAWVNPILPPMRGSDVVIYYGDDTVDRHAMIKTLVTFNDTDWTLEQYSPAKKFKKSRTEWPVCHAVVGCFRRR